MKWPWRAAILTGLALAVLASGCWVAGYWWLPYLARTQGLSRASALLGARLEARNVSFDPLAFIFKVQDLALHDPQGRDFVRVGELEVDLDLAASLREKTLVLTGRIGAPAARLSFDAEGRGNYSFLTRGEERDGHGGALPFRVDRLVLDQGRLDFEDAGPGHGFKLELGSIDLELTNLGAEGKARFRLSAAGNSGLSLHAEGDLGLHPLHSQGRLELAGVDLAQVLEHYAHMDSLAIRSARAGTKLDYVFAAGGKTALTLQGEELWVEDLGLSQSSNADPWLQSDSLKLRNINYVLGESRIRLVSGELYNLTLPLSQTSAPGGRATVQTPPSNGGRLGGGRDSKLQPYQDSPSPQPPPAGRGSERLCGRIDRLEFGGLECDWTRRSLEISHLISDGAEFHLRRVADAVRLDGLPEMGKEETAQTDEAPPWRVRVDEVRLEGYGLGLRDEAISPPLELRFSPLSLHMNDLSNEPGRQFRFFLQTGVDQGARIELDGQASLQPLEAEVRFGVDKLWLPRFQPYWNSRVGFDLTQGRFNMWGDFGVRDEGGLRLEYSGAADITDLATLDKREGKDLLLWRSLKLDGIVFATQPRRLSIRSIGIEKPYARVFIDSTGGLNLARDLVKPDPAPSGEEKSPVRTPATQESKGMSAGKAGWPVVIGAVRVNEGRMDFTDQTLKPNFAAAIHSLTGSMHSLSSQTDVKSDLYLEGSINGDSTVRIIGQMNPFRFAEQTDVAMHFRDVNLTTLSPYSGKFAGYRIEKGKLNMDLHYKLANRKLFADNKVILDHLVLGERVKSEKATNLPVSLAISLLRDSEGRIDIDLPISGNLDDPEFSVRDLLGEAVAQLITKLVTSPFAVLGNLIQDGGEEMGYVNFKPGQSTLERAERDKLGKVAEALKQRPSLNLDIRGMADLARDREALAETALLRQLKEARLFELRQVGQAPKEGEDPALPEQDYARLLTQLCRRRLPNAPELRSLEETRQEVLGGSLLEGARRRMLQKWAVDELELRLLAQARGESIRQFLVKETGLPDQRIYLLDVDLEQPAGREIRAFLSLSGS